VNQYFSAAVVDDRRRTLMAEAEHARMVRLAKDGARRPAGEKHRAFRWRLLLPHLRFSAPRVAVNEM
jgi:hypothetical protein